MQPISMSVVFLLMVVVAVSQTSTQNQTPSSTLVPSTEPTATDSTSNPGQGIRQQDEHSTCTMCCRGLPGPPGVPGVPGSLGTYGMPGPRGKTGLSGEPGLRGERGFKGLAGDVGEPGPVGAVGSPGSEGVVGLPGTAGPRGPTGSVGPRGFVGRSGRPGFYGQKGDRGYPGIPAWQQRQVAFSVSLTEPFMGDNGQVLLFDEIFTNLGDGYSIVDGMFRCPTAGVYVFMYNIGFKEDPPKIGLMKNDERMATVYSTADIQISGDQGQMGSGLILPLTYGDSVWLQFLKENGKQVYSDESRITNFSGFLLYEN